MNKTDTTVRLISRRISKADYCSGDLPSERTMAEEFGVSRPTVRAALEILLANGTLKRMDNGRLAVAFDSSAKRQRVIGFAIPPHLAQDLELWRMGAFEAVEGTGAVMRMLTYTHWEDTVLSDALKNFDGLFLLPPSEAIPAWLRTCIQNAKCRVAVLDQDESAAGIPSIVMFPPKAEYKLFDHLMELGHKRIDCINTQAANPVIQSRIKAWQDYIATNDITGRLWSKDMFSPMETAYLLTKDLLESGKGIGSAVYCPTGPAAIGCMRALHEAGLEVGADVSVCTINDEGMGKYLLKSLTSLEVLPRAAFMHKPATWMLSGDDWDGLLVMQPEDIAMFAGESTGPCNDSTIIHGRLQ